jgi:hypothetical protein
MDKLTTTGQESGYKSNIFNKKKYCLFYRCPVQGLSVVCPEYEYVPEKLNPSADIENTNGAGVPLSQLHVPLSTGGLPAVVPDILPRPPL